MVAVATQSTLFDEPTLYHTMQSCTTATFGTFAKMSSGRTASKCYPVEEMTTWINAVRGRPDTYISQAQFRGNRRCIAEIDSLGSLWADCGDDGELAKLGHSGAVKAILKACDDAEIPKPSLIVFSGRGYHAKWLFTERLFWALLDKWNAVECTIIQRLRESLNADPLAKDASRVLRLVGTINTKTGLTSCVVYDETDNNEIIRYNFDDLHRLLAAPLKAERNERTSPDLVVAPRTLLTCEPFASWEAGLWWRRYRDIRRLCAMRGWTPENGGVPEGYRDLVLFLLSVCLSWVTTPPHWSKEVEALGHQLVPTLTATERKQYTSTVYKRLMATVKAHEAGCRGEARYKYGNAKLVALLDISLLEMASMESLVSVEVARTRKLTTQRQQRQQAGSVDRDTYLATAANRAQEARKLATQGLSIREIAHTLDISKSLVQRAIASLAELSQVRS
jgi:hypothetical protein